MNTMVALQGVTNKDELLQNVGKFVAILEEQCEECTSLDEIYMLKSIVLAFKKFVADSFPFETIVLDVFELTNMVEAQLQKLLKLGGYKNA